MTRRRYKPEFKKEAARMIIIDGTPVSEVSKLLGVPSGMLYSWKRQYLSELGSGAPSGAPDPNAMADEIARLRKELAQTKVMNEILKKTVGYFSKVD